MKTLLLAIFAAGAYAQAPAGGASNSIDPGTFAVGNQIFICPLCSVTNPWRFFNGKPSATIVTVPIALTITQGNGQVVIWVDKKGVEVGLLNVVATCVGCQVQNVSTAAYPPGVLPVSIWQVASGLASGAGTDDYAISAVPAQITGGDRITIQQTPSGDITISSVSDVGSPTVFWRDHWNFTSLFNKGVESWSYTNCGNGTATFHQSAETTMPGVWAQAMIGGGPCLFYYPGDYPAGLGAAFDYWSGASPPSLMVSAIYTTADGNGTHYIGLASSSASIGDFIGCRQVGNADWFAVIRSGGMDVAVADTGTGFDSTAAHRITVTNNETAGNIQCSIDGAAAATASGAIPAEVGGWYYIEGAVSNGTAPAVYGAFRHQIRIGDLPVR